MKIFQALAAVGLLILLLFGLPGLFIYLGSGCAVVATYLTIHHILHLYGRGPEHYYAKGFWAVFIILTALAFLFLITAGLI